MANQGQQTGAQMTVVPNLYLDFLPPEWRDKERDYFAYAVTALNLLAGATVTPTFSVEATSLFLATSITGTARDPAAAGTRFANPALTVLVTSQGSGRNVTNQAVDWLTFVGTSELPMFLPYPRLFEPRSVVNVQLVNFDPGQAYDCRVTFHGFKVFNFRRGT
jgi:hypothetical protein